MKKRTKIESDDDFPELTSAGLKRFRPARDMEPLLADISAKKFRGKQKKPTKRLVSLRLSPDVLAHFKATGKGWQTRLDEALQLLIGKVS